MSKLVEENITAEQISPRWFIDLGWYQQSNRSFLAMAQSCLCSKCREKLKEDASADDLVVTIKDYNKLDKRKKEGL